MRLATLSRWLDQITQPQYPYYHAIQVTLFAGFSYVSTACLTSIPPKRGMTLAVLIYAISHFTAPLFSQLLEPYQEVSLVPLIGQVFHICLSVLLAKVICRLVGQSLTFKEIRQISLVFLVSLCVMRFALLKFRQQLRLAR